MSLKRENRNNRIVFDGRVLAHSGIDGVQRHARELSRALKRNGLDVDIAIPVHRNRYIQQVWEHTQLPFMARNYDLLYCPSNIAPLYIPPRTKMVMTLHDLAFLDFPDKYTNSFRKYYSSIIPKNLSRASKIITPSLFMKKRILEEYPWIEGKILAIHHGISSFFFFYDDIIEEKCEEDYVLYVGSMNEIKNFEAPLHIFLSNDFKRLKLKMILPGIATFTRSSSTASLINQAQKAENIEIINSIDQEQLRDYYRKAKLFLFPSFHESFGFPPLEAMACGTPAIVSNTTALPEVCGDAAVYCDPYDIDDIKEKIETLLENEALRVELRHKGLERAKLFTWENAAEEHMRVFKEVLKS